MRAVLLAVAVILLLALSSQRVNAVSDTCTSSVTSDTIPTNPGITGFVQPPRAVSSGCSEVVDVVTQGSYPSVKTWASGVSVSSSASDLTTRTSCPHLDLTDLKYLDVLYPNLAAGDSVTLSPPNTRVLLRQCALPANQGALFRITVNSGSTLIIDDAPLSLYVREIVVNAGAQLLAGSPTCRLFSSITITFVGTKADSNTVDNPTGGTTSKGLLGTGLVEIHSKQYHPTWTRLAQKVLKGSTQLILQDNVNWEVGQQIVITPSVLYDCPDQWAPTYCKPGTPIERHQNEIRTITALLMDPTTASYVITINSPLNFQHYAGPEYQCEVALLTRRFVVRGSPSNDNFGGHMKFTTEARISGVQGHNMGQLNVLGRYPFHAHMMGNTLAASRTYFQDCSATHSSFRAFVVHGTNRTRVSRNVAFNITGFAYYLEDGVEENNLLEFNAAFHVHPIFKPADGGYGQGGELFIASASLIVPADTSASGFYAPNAMNSWIGNAASGGWSGFAFPNTPAPLGNFKDTLTSNSRFNPDRRPLLKFYGNTAHSTGFYWLGHGSGVYVGAKLDYNGGGVMQYMSGRNDRDSINADGTESIMVFESTKVWLSGKGLSHWGNTVEVKTAEFHDVKTSCMLFGSATVFNTLINGRTPNLLSNSVSQSLVASNQMGFQFYDTWVQTILSNVTFRNFTGVNAYAIRYMDHSDHYTPQGINAVTNLRFENVPDTARIGIDNCGSACGTSHTTQSSRIYSVWDTDGSLVGTGTPTIFGSHENWWNFGPDCVYRTASKVWTCNWTSYKSIGFVMLSVPGIQSSSGCDTAKFGTCTDQYAPNTVGTVSSWGAAAATTAMSIAPWPGVAGITNTGWHWRVTASDYGIDGAPSQFTVGDSFQLQRGHFIVLSIKYPANAAFTVRMYSQWWDIEYPVLTPVTKNAILTATEDIKPHNQFTCTGQWYDFCTNTGGIGPAYHWDGTHLFLRLVSPGCYNANQKANCAGPSVWYDSNHGARVPDIMGGFVYRVTATCPGCTVQSTNAGVTYWSVTDSAPAAFANAWGTVSSTPIPQPKPAGAFSCPAAIALPPVGSAGNNGGGPNDGAGDSSTGLELTAAASAPLVSWMGLIVSAAVAVGLARNI